MNMMQSPFFHREEEKEATQYSSAFGGNLTQNHNAESQ